MTHSQACRPGGETHIPWSPNYTALVDVALPRNFYSLLLFFLSLLVPDWHKVLYLLGEVQSSVWSSLCGEGVTYARPHTHTHTRHLLLSLRGLRELRGIWPLALNASTQSLSSGLHRTPTQFAIRPLSPCCCFCWRRATHLQKCHVASVWCCFLATHSNTESSEACT